MTHPTTALTNAVGRVADHVEYVLREVRDTVDAHDVHVRGDEMWHLAVVERGHALPPPSVVIERSSSSCIAVSTGGAGACAEFGAASVAADASKIPRVVLVSNRRVILCLSMGAQRLTSLR